MCHRFWGEKKRDYWHLENRSSRLFGVCDNTLCYICDNRTLPHHTLFGDKKVDVYLHNYSTIIV